MTPEAVTDILQNALYMAVILGAPILLATLVVGVAVSVLQAATQINEMTLTFIPKLMVAGAAIWTGGDWMLQQWLAYTAELWQGLVVVP